MYVMYHMFTPEPETTLYTYACHVALPSSMHNIA